LLRDRFESADQVVAHPSDERQESFYLGTSNPNALVEPEGSVTTGGEIVLIDSPGIVHHYVTPVHHQVYEVALFLIDVLKDINIKPALQRACGRHDALKSQVCKFVSSFRGGRELR
jgi:hypothetical protein